MSKETETAIDVARKQPTDRIFDIEALIHVGNALADAVGHNVGCPKVSPMVPCVCGHGFQQSKAISDWKSLVRRLKNNT